MLRIEKVFLQGFKSFNDPTELVFDAEGITAVVGPNGCGKSNIADALSWVIGEQRVKALRGGKMEDVIFQGSRHRMPSGMAEVVLTMRVYESFELRPQETNTAHTSTPEESDESKVASDVRAESESEAPPQALTTRSQSQALPSRVFQAGERITVARRLYRTGESEYEMNGKTSRLRDIQDLFAGTGLGGAHYAIIEQGRIGQVLSAKPMDRRALIEEAAGISKFKMRQRAAELKLDAARQNLSRVTDIIAEVERQVGALKRQAAKSRRYQRLREEMRQVLRAVFIADYRQTEQTVQELESYRLATNEQESDISAQIASADVSRQTTFTQVEQLEAQLTTARATAAQTNLQLEKARQQQTYWQEQAQALQARAAQFSHDQVAISERERLIAQEIARLRAEVKLIDEEINTEAQSLSQLEALFHEQATQDDQVEKELELAQRRVTEAATQRERWHQLVRQFEEAVERTERTITGLTAEQQRTSEQAQSLAEEHQEIQARFLAQSEQQATLQQQRAALLAQLEAKNQAAGCLETELQHLQKEFTTLDQRLKSRQELDERRANFSEPVQAIIKAVKEKSQAYTFNIIGTLADYIKVAPQDEVIVEVGLREELQYLITPSFEDALQAIDYLKQENLGRATFLVLNAKPIPAPLPEFPVGSSVVRLIDLLGLKPDLQHIIQQALPRLSHTVITDELQQAISDSISTNGKGHSFLTSTGEFISAGHIIAGGSTTEQSTGILALKREIESLQNELHQREQQLSQQEQGYDKLKAETQFLTRQLDELDQHLRALDKTLVLIQGQQQQLEREQERTATHLRVVEKELEQAQREEQEGKEKQQHAAAEWKMAEEQLTAAERSTSETQEIVAEIRKNAAARTQELSGRRADFAAKSERRKGFLNDLRRLENEAQDIHSRLTRAQLEALETETRAQTLAHSIATAAAEIEILAQQWQQETYAVEAMQQETTAVKETLQAHEQQLTQLRESLLALREKRTDLEVTRAKRLAHIEHITTSCQAELGVSLAELAAQPEQSPSLKSPTEELATAPTNDEEEDDADRSLFVDDRPEDFEMETSQRRLQDLRQKVDAIGPVNLLALEELDEAEQRLIFLLEQKADIEQAVSDTLAVIAELKRRSRDRFLQAFHQINQNFTAMFLELFGGGHGEMRLIDTSDVLESGIDIIAQPPGKRLQNVLLLSGGEKAMAALALIMGIFKFRPSPFCLLDEVDAPLDDVNIGRFADKVLEMSSRTQFLIITHSKRTMEAAKALYGVTMEDPGVSKLISVRLT
jgi:chromosome segregation protein